MPRAPDCRALSASLVTYDSISSKSFIKTVTVISVVQNGVVGNLLIDALLMLLLLNLSTSAIKGACTKIVLFLMRTVTAC